MEKFILKSKTIWGAIFMAAPAIRPFLTVLGIELPAGLEDQADVAFQASVTALEAASAAFGAWLTIYGRIKAGGVTINPLKKEKPVA